MKYLIVAVSLVAVAIGAHAAAEPGGSSDRTNRLDSKVPYGYSKDVLLETGPKGGSAYRQPASHDNADARGAKHESASSRGDRGE